ncbi:MAG: Spy/CpxP family protein refolding chaperone [Pleurocapsa sp.]
MLSTRWHSLFSITATTFFIIVIIHISPVFASSRSPFPTPNNNQFFKTTTIADNSVVTGRQNPSNLLHQLDLTSRQKEQIKRIHQQYKQQIRKKRSNLTILQQQLSDLMMGTESVDLIRAKNRQLVNLREEIGELRFESMLATREILTPQQRQKFREIIELQSAQ